MSALYKWLGGLLIVIAVLGAAWWKGRTHGYDQRDLECKAEVQKERDKTAEAERQAAALGVKARTLSDRLANQAAAAQVQIEAIRRSAQDEIERSVSASRRLLDERVVRLLNQLSPIRESSGPATPAPGAGVAPEVPRAAGHPAGPGASERSVVRALTECRVGYASCASTHNALATYVESITQ